MLFKPTITFEDGDSLTIEKSVVKKIFTIVVCIVIWTVLYFGIIHDLIKTTFSFNEITLERENWIAIVGEIGISCLAVYWSTKSIYENIILDKDIFVRLDKNFAELHIQSGQNRDVVKIQELVEIRLKKTGHDQGGESTNLLLVTKSKQYFLLTQSEDEICHQLADRLNLITGIKIESA